MSKEKKDSKVDREIIRVAIMLVLSSLAIGFALSWALGLI